MKHPHPIISLRILSTLLLVIAGLCPLSAAPPQPAPVKNPADLVFFESKIRPVLVERCYKCHQEKQKGGLRLDNRDALLAGGQSGPAIESGNPDASLLIQAVRYAGDGVEKMPPDKKLPDHQVNDLVRWVKTGAPWPESTAPAKTSSTTAAHRQEFQISDRDRNYWAFRPVSQPPIPAVRNALWPRTAVDRFILAQLESKSLQPASPATRRDLLRRASFDLIGLPPTPEQLRAFETDRLPTPMRASSTPAGKSPVRANAGRGTGSMSSAMRRPMDTNETTKNRSPGATATTSSTPSTKTSRTISSSANSSPATAPLPSRPERSSPPASTASASGTTNPTTSARPPSTSSMTSSPPPARPSSA